MTNFKPKEYSLILPFLLSTDIDKALGFYEKVFGFSKVNVNVQDEKIVHAELEYHGQIVALIAPEGAHGPEIKTPNTFGHTPSISIFLYIENVDEVYKRALKAGAKGEREPFDVPWGERFAFFHDLDGYHWHISQVQTTD